MRKKGKVLTTDFTDSTDSTDKKEKTRCNIRSAAGYRDAVCGIYNLDNEISLHSFMSTRHAYDTGIGILSVSVASVLSVVKDFLF